MKYISSYISAKVSLKEIENTVKEDASLKEWYITINECCDLLLEDRSQQIINEGLFDKIKGNASKFFSSMFSTQSWLSTLSSKREDKDADEKDPVRKQYLENLQEKRKNAERRRKELATKRKALKAQGIKLQHKMQETALENAHQQVMKLLNSQIDDLKAQNDHWQTLYENIKDGNPVPQDILNKEIERQERATQNVIDGLPADAKTKAEQAQDAWIEARYVEETDPHGNINYDENGKPKLRPRTPEEFKDYLDAHPNLKAAIDATAEEGRKAIGDMSIDELKEFMDIQDAADPLIQTTEASTELVNAMTDETNAINVKTALAEETKSYTDKKKAKEEYDEAKTAQAAAKTKYDAIKGIAEGDDKIAQMYEFIDKNKSKQPWKSILAKGGEGGVPISPEELAKKLKGAVGDDNQINLDNLKKAFEDQQLLNSLPEEYKENGGDGAISFNIEKAFPVDNKGKRKTALSDSTTAKQYIKDRPLKAATDNLSSKNTELENKKQAAKDAKVEFNGDEAIEPKLELTQGLKDKLTDMGIDPDGDLALVEATVKSMVTDKENKRIEAAKKLQDLRDKSSSFYERYEDAKKENKRAEVYNNNAEKKRQETINAEMQKTKNIISDGVEKENADGSIELTYTDENGKPKTIKRPADLTDKEAMFKYNRMKQVALVQRAANGELTSPESRVIPYVVKENGEEVVKYAKVPYNSEYTVKVDDSGNATVVDKNGNEVTDGVEKSISEENATEIDIASRRFENDKAEVKKIMQTNKDNLPEDVKNCIQKVFDDNKDTGFLEDFDIDSNEIDWEAEDEQDDEDLSTEEKELKDAEDKAKELKDGEGNQISQEQLEQEIKDLPADEPTKNDNETDADFEKRHERWKILNDVKQKREALEGNDNDKTKRNTEDSDDEDGKPKPPKRKIKKVPSKKKGFYKYVYKSEEGKKLTTSKEDWRKNKAAWARYKRRLAKWQKEHAGQQNSSWISDYLKGKLVVEHFTPKKDISEYLKSYF